MSILLVALPEVWSPVVWCLMGVFAGLGFVALTNPRLFASMAVRGGRWVDTSKAVAKLDQRINIDEFVLPHARWLGAAVLASVGALGFVLLRF